MTLLLAWNADEASGDALDKSGNGRNLSFTSNNVSRVTGHTNTGLQQTSAGTTLGPAVAPLLTSTRTMMCWFKLNSAVNSWALEFYRSTSMPSPNDTGVWGILCLSSVLHFRAKDPSNTAFDVNLPSNLGAWHHIAATFDGSKLWVYYDGTLVNTGGTTITAGLWSSADTFRVFDQSGSSMTIDDVRLYDTALDQATISTLMGQPVTDPAVTGTIAANLPAMTGSIAGDAVASAVLTATLPSLTGAETGNVTVGGTLAGVLPAVQGAITGDAVAAAQLAGALPALQASFAGDIAAVSGQLAGQLGAITSSFAGTARASGSLVGTMHALVAAFACTVGQGAPYDPVTDPIATIRSNLATATPRDNAATAVIRANPAEAAP